MKLTVFSDYTLRVLMYLATERERMTTIPEIAAAYGISENHLMKVVHQLARTKVIESVRGKGGGIRLMRDPAEIRLGQVVRVSTHPGAMVRFLRSGIFWYIAPASPCSPIKKRPPARACPGLRLTAHPRPISPQAHQFLPHPRQQAEADFRRVLLISRQVPQQEAIFQAGA